MKELTRAEEEVMRILWELRSAFVNDIISELPEPKPAYTTISTIVRILEQKGFIAHDAKGRFHKYYPLISKEAYTKSFMKSFVGKYFSGSYRNMVSFFTKENNLSVNELQQLLNELKEKEP
jgi:predicted transcriptional regulator